MPKEISEDVEPNGASFELLLWQFLLAPANQTSRVLSDDSSIATLLLLTRKRSSLSMTQ